MNMAQTTFTYGDRVIVDITPERAEEYTRLGRKWAQERGLPVPADLHIGSQVMTPTLCTVQTYSGKNENQTDIVHDYSGDP
jgi:hypothetical protein